MPRPKSLIRFIAACALLFAPLSAFSQVDRGSIKGLVHDENNAVVPNANLDLKNESTGVAQQSQSLGTGEYSFLNLPAGSYVLSAQASAFGKSVQQHILVTVGSVSSVDITLHPASVETTVQVSSVGDTVDAETSEIGTAITPQEIADLPVPMSSDMRNPLSFVALTPGVVGSEPGAEPDYRLHISGSPSDSNEVYIDGIPIVNTAFAGDASLNHPPIDAISQFKIVNNNQSAQYGLASSAVSFAFKSGTNAPHGSLFEYLQNDKLNANGFVGDALNQKRAPLKQNEYGGTFGGPIWIPKLYNGRDRSFFFVEYTQFSWRPSSNNASLTTFPNAYRAGNFQQALGPQLMVNGNPVTDLLGRPVYRGEIYDPASTSNVTVNGTTYVVRNPFPNNSIDPARFSKVSSNVLNAFPAATTNGIQNNFFRVQSTKNDEHRLVLKLDHSINAKHSLSGSIFMGTYENSNNGSLSEYNGAATDAPTKQFRLSYNYVHSPHMTNNLNLGFLRDRYTNGPAQYGPGLANLGITGLPPQSGLQPYPSVGLLGDLSTGIGGFNVAAVAENRYILSDNLTLIHGRHTFTVGGELRRLQRNENTVGVASFTFDAPETALNGVGYAGGQLVPLPGGTGNSGASFLVGAVDFSYNNFPISQGYRWLQTGYYAQDDWRVNPRLVLNLGVRYDILVPRTEVNGYASTVDPSLPNPNAGGIPGAYTFYGQGAGRNNKPRIGNIDYKAIQPRLGFAFTPFSSQKTAVRGGYAITRPSSNDNLENGIGAAQYSVGFSGTAIASKPGDTVGSPAFYWDNSFPQGGVTGAQLNPGILVGITNPTIISPKSGSASTQMNWALQVEQELPGKMIANLGYVGSHAYHIGVWSKPNEISPTVAAKYSAFAAQFPDFYDQPINSAAATAAGVTAPWPGFASAVGPAAATIGQALRPFPQYGSVDFPINPIGSVSYNGLQASLQRRYSSGLTLLLSYTFSKTIGNVDTQNGASAGAENAIYGASFYQDYYNPRAERSVTSSDIPHAIALSYTYQLPVGRGKRYLNHGGVTNAVLGGWEVSGIHQYQSGRPIHIEYDAFGAGNPYRAHDGYSFRPNVVPGQPLKNPGYRKSCSGPSSLPQYHQECSFYINPNAFVAPPLGVFGNAPHFFSSLRLPWYLNENLSASKRFPFYRESNLHFEANLFNAFNRTVFSNGGNANTFIFNGAPPSLADAASSSSVFGLWTAQQNAPRVIQFALKLEF